MAADNLDPRRQRRVGPAWLHRDALVKALEAETDALASDRDSLTDAQRAAKEAEIEADLVAVQREEIALIAKAAADGLHIASRADCDPRAVLGIV
jgi:hypothetical protein